MSDPLPIVIPKEVEAQIRRHGEEQYPYEACGALFGTGDGAISPWRVSSALPAPNDHGDDRRRRYRIPPEFQVRAEMEARAANVDVLGYYHSHPDHPARPSEYDRSHAWLGYVYVICSVKEGRSADLNAFTLEEQGGEFLDVGIRESPTDTSPTMPC